MPVIDAKERGEMPGAHGTDMTDDNIPECIARVCHRLQRPGKQRTRQLGRRAIGKEPAAIKLANHGERIFLPEHERSPCKRRRKRPKRRVPLPLSTTIQRSNVFQVGTPKVRSCLVSAVAIARLERPTRATFQRARTAFLKRPVRRSHTLIAAPLTRTTSP